MRRCASLLPQTLWRLLTRRASKRVRALLKLRAAAQEQGCTRCLKWCTDRLQTYGIFIDPGAQVSGRARFPHPTGIVIGQGVVLEDDVRVFQNVTLGGARIGDHAAGRYPHVGEGTTLFAGCVIIGAVRIGRHCTIGANAVVTTDIPDGATAVGVPARIITAGADR